MRSTRTAVALAAALAIPALLLTACTGATRSGSVYTMKADREIETYLPGSVGEVHDAALYVVRERLRYRVLREAVDAREGVIEARTARDAAVRVETYRESAAVTRIEVFVGPFGDEPAMKEILSEIEAEQQRARRAATTPGA